MTESILYTLMFFATIAFAASGIAFSVARAREHEEGNADVGMRAVATLLFTFGAACMYVSVGLSGIFAFGGIVTWFAYVIAAQRVGVFRIVQARPVREPVPQRRRIA